MMLNDGASFTPDLCVLGAPPAELRCWGCPGHGSQQGWCRHGKCCRHRKRVAGTGRGVAGPGGCPRHREAPVDSPLLSGTFHVLLPRGDAHHGLPRGPAAMASPVCGGPGSRSEETEDSSLSRRPHPCIRCVTWSARSLECWHAPWKHPVDFSSSLKTRHEFERWPQMAAHGDPSSVRRSLSWAHAALVPSLPHSSPWGLPQASGQPTPGPWHPACARCAWTCLHLKWNSSGIRDQPA